MDVIPKAETPPSNAPRLHGIDYCRGIAAVLVVFCHAGIPLNVHYNLPFYEELFRFGAKGVDFFFVLSGFVICYSCYDQLGNPAYLREYFLRRFLRIYPILWIAIAGLLAASIVNPPDRRLDTLTVVSSLLLAPAPVAPFPIVVWTLKHEILFYILFSWFYFSPRQAIVGFGLWSVISSANFWEIVPHNFISDWFLSPYNIEFLLGLCVAYAVRHTKVKMVWTMLSCATALFVGACIAYIVFHQHDDSEFPWAPNPPDAWIFVFGPLSAFITFSVAQLDLQSKTPRIWILSLLGSASYSIYLVHSATLAIAWRVIKVARIESWLSFDLIFLLLVTLATTGGVVFSLMFEQPIIHFTRRILKKKKAKQ